MTTVALGALRLDAGGHLLLVRAIRAAAPGATIQVTGDDPSLPVLLGAWCRAEGLACSGTTLVAGPLRDRWPGAERAEGSAPGAVHPHPSPAWGLAARGAAVEAGLQPFDFRLVHQDDVWADEAGRLYAQAAAAQWDPATLPWSTPLTHPDLVEDAVVTVFTYLIENEVAALMVPTRFLGTLHPHFREVMQLLAIQGADEARHIEVFTRRIAVSGRPPGLSTRGGQESLRTLLDEGDFALASFLLSVLGEGTFLELLWFLHEHAPDPLTRELTRLAAQDEARHVAFGLAHLTRHAQRDSTLLPRLSAAVERRYDALRNTAGLNEEVADALVVIAAGSLEPDAIQRGWAAVEGLRARMDANRQARLLRLGLEAPEAARLSTLHTRNFM